MSGSDSELCCVQLLTPLLGVRVVTELPATLQAPDSLPIVQVVETPGGASLGAGHLDTCVMEYNAYATGREAARNLAEATRQALLSAAGFRTADTLMWISRVVDTRKPTILFYDEASEVRRFGGNVRLYLRYKPDQ